MTGHRQPALGAFLLSLLCAMFTAYGFPTAPCDMEHAAWPLHAQWDIPVPTVDFYGKPALLARRAEGWVTPCFVAKGLRTGFFGASGIRYGEAANPGPRTQLGPQTVAAARDTPTAQISALWTAAR